MKKIVAPLLLMSALLMIDIHSQVPTGKEVLKQIDKNLVLDKAVSNITMVIHNRNGSRTIKSKNWVDGKDKAFVEYTDPVREKGKKMLKLQNQVWVYFPAHG